MSYKNVNLLEQYSFLKQVHRMIRIKTVQAKWKSQDVKISMDINVTFYIYFQPCISF